MALEIVPVQAPHLPELARICFEAFATLHDRHSVPRDFPDAQATGFLLDMLHKRDDFFGVAALLDGKPVGSNFLQTSDAVAAVGPITVDPAVQARGIGRALMRAVLDPARERGIAHVRLYQETINAASLSLYTSLGFSWRDSIAIVQLAPAAADDPTIRPLASDDLPVVDSLSKAHYHHSRRNEVAAALAWRLPGLVRERGGRITGYLLPGYFGHGFAESHEDMLALLGQSARMYPAPFQRILLPLSQADFFRRCLGAGHRTLKVGSYMTIGPYTPPREVWLPSIGC